MEEPSPKGCHVTQAKVLSDLGATHSPLCICTQSEPGATSGLKASSCSTTLVPVNKNRETAAKLSVGSGAQNMRIPTSRANSEQSLCQLLNSTGDCMPCLRNCAHASLLCIHPQKLNHTKSHLSNGAPVLFCFLLALLSEKQNLFCLNLAPYFYHHS